MAIDRAFSGAATEETRARMFNLCFKNDVIAQFRTIEAAVYYANLEFDSYFVVDAATGEVVASQCLHEHD